MGQHLRSIGLAAACLVGGTVACARDVGPENAFTRTAEHLLDAVESDGAIATAMVIERRTGRVLYARRPGTRLIPASTMKVLATSAALETFGPDWRFRTRLALEGAQEGNDFRGDLVIESSGDPSLGSWRWPETDKDATCDAVAAALRAREITRLAGRIRIEQRPDTATTPYGPGWAWDDTAYDYSAPPAPFSFRENTVDLVVTRPNEEPCAAPVVRLQPALGAPTLQMQVRTTSVGQSLACAPGDGTVLCTWMHPETECPRRAQARVASADPQSLFAGCVERALEKAGIARVDGEAAGELMRETVAQFESPPLSELVRVTNKDSLNLYAERLALEFARSWTGREDYEALRSAYAAYLARGGIDPGDLRPVDGSGLSRYNLATARGLVGVLRMGLDSAHGETLRESLSIAGVDGTLRRLALSEAATGRVRAKTGGMSGQRAFVGVVERADGTELLFALMLGNLASPVWEANQIFRHFAEAMVVER